MSVWKGGVWGSQKFPGGSGVWKGGAWLSQRSATATQVLRNLLFGSGQQGAFFVPQPTVDGQQVLFQDSAGTTPVTADGQPVGLMLDLHKGQHGSNGSRRINYALYSEEFDNSEWTKLGVTVSPDASISPNGTTTADKLIASVDAGTHRIFQEQAMPDQDLHVSSVYVAAAEYNYVWVAIYNSVVGKYRYAIVNLLNGQVESKTADVSVIVSAESSGFYRISVAGTTSLVNVKYLSISPMPSATPDSFSSVNEPQFSGDGVSGVYIWGGQIESGDALSGYQIITSSWPDTIPGNHATQATAAAKSLYKTTGLLQQYDGVDDVTNVTPPAIASATVITAKATGVVVQYPVDLSSGSYTITESHSGIIIREGQLSASEEQSAVDYLSGMQGVA